MFRTNSIIKIVILLPVFIVLTWLFVHLFAIFGYFIAIGFIILWLLFPQSTICFVCRVKNAGDYCPFCRKNITGKDSRIPKSLRSVFFNSGLIVLVSFFSLILVFAEFEGIKLIESNSIGRTVSFEIPTNGQFVVGEIFPMKIEISGVGRSINAVQSDISFDPLILEVIDINTKNSFANIFVQKEINNTLGYARISGGLPNPGFNGKNGIFATVLFKAKKTGVVEVKFLPSSLVLANDKSGTNVLKDFATASYLIKPETNPLKQESSNEELSHTEESNVLGEDDDTQLKFYNDSENVLGASVDENTKEEEEGFGPFDFIVDLIGTIDELILYPFKLIVSLFQKSS